MWRSKSKFGNKTSVVCQLRHSHDSKLESAVCGLLYLRWRAGEIGTHIDEYGGKQPCIWPQYRMRVCGPRDHECTHKTEVIYVADFRCLDEDGKEFFVEPKGMETAVWRIKRRLWIHHKIGRLEIWGGSYHAPVLVEVIGG
jgi:hypothetical protein